MSNLEDEKEVVQHHEHVPVTNFASEEGERRPKGRNTQLDDAARLLEEAGGHVEYTLEDSKRVLRKIDFWVCIPMCLTYFIQQVSSIHFPRGARAHP